MDKGTYRCTDNWISYQEYSGLYFVYWYRIGNESKIVADTDIHIFLQMVTL